MTKPNAGLLRTSRLLNLVPYLVSHQGIELEALSKQFAITEEQLLEDLNTLWMCGLPGYTPLELMDLAFDSGFVTIRNADELQNPRALNNEEVVVLLMGLDYLRGQLVEGNNDITATIDKLVTKLAATLKGTLRNNLSAQVSVSAKIRDTILSAIQSQSTVVIEYHSPAQDEVSQRLVHPVDIFSAENHEYIEAFCELSQDYRTFRFDRITTADISESVLSKISPKINLVQEKLTFEVLLLARERDICERLHITSFNHDEHRSHAVMVEGYSQNWLIREIMSLGGSCVLTHPLEVRESIKSRAENALKAYQRP